MFPLIVLMVGFVVFRLARLDSVRSLRYAMAVMFLITATAHWGDKRADLVRMVPPFFPQPELLVTLTGVLEIAGAIGLVWTRTARLAAAGLALMLVAMFPANVYAALHDLTIGGQAVTALPLRTAVQVVLIAAAVAIAWGRREASGGRARPAAFEFAQSRSVRHARVQARPTNAAGRARPPEAPRRPASYNGARVPTNP